MSAFRVALVHSPKIKPSKLRRAGLDLIKSKSLYVAIFGRPDTQLAALILSFFHSILEYFSCRCNHCLKIAQHVNNKHCSWWSTQLCWSGVNTFAPLLVTSLLAVTQSLYQCVVCMRSLRLPVFLGGFLYEGGIILRDI